MKNKKKFIAIAGVSFLLLLFTSALFFAIFDNTENLIYLKTSIAATFFFPVMFYVMMMVYKLNKNDDDMIDHDDDSTM